MTTLMEVHEPEIQEKPEAKESALKLSPPPFVPPVLFADVLLEVDSTERRRRKWSALSSIVFQCLMLATALILPLMFTEALPKAQLLTFLVAPPPPPPPPPPAAAAPPVQVRRVESDLLNGRLRSPSRIPQKVQMIREDETPPQLSSGGVVGGVPGGVPGGQMNGVIGGIISATSNMVAIPKLAPVTAKRVRISQGVIAGMVIYRVEPEYLLLARQARIQGEVVMTAIISKEGTIENLQVVSGHPLLLQAALNAVKQWRYRPFMVSGEPVEVETKITATFRFAS
jgi:periplasmic protein TonB